MTNLVNYKFIFQQKANPWVDRAQTVLRILTIHLNNLSIVIQPDCRKNVTTNFHILRKYWKLSKLPFCLIALAGDVPSARVPPPDQLWDEHWVPSHCHTPTGRAMLRVQVCSLSHHIFMNFLM